MHRWQRPAVAPIPRRQALTDSFRRLDPRRVVRGVVSATAIVVFTHVGWQWRAATVELGARTDVVVMERSIAAGERITADDVRVVAWPVSLVPRGAIPSLPTEAVARDELILGEVLISDRLFPSENGLGPGQRLVTIPQPLAPSPVEIGAAVELFGLLPIGDGLTTPATRLAEGTVVSTTESTVSVAVAADQVPRLIEHVALGIVDIVVMP